MKYSYVTGPAIINHVSTERFFLSLLYHNLQQNLICITTAEFNGLPSEIYWNGITHSELKMLVKTQLSTYMVDYCRPGHILVMVVFQIPMCVHSYYTKLQMINKITNKIKCHISQQKQCRCYVLLLVNFTATTVTPENNAYWQSWGYYF